MSARDQLREAVASGELVPVTAAAPETPATPGQAALTVTFTWDYREQPPMEAIASRIAQLTGGTVTMEMPETGSDEYELVIAARQPQPAPGELPKGHFEHLQAIGVADNLRGQLHETRTALSTLLDRTEGTSVLTGDERDDYGRVLMKPHGKPQPAPGSASQVRRHAEQAAPGVCPRCGSQERTDRRQVRGFAGPTAACYSDWHDAGQPAPELAAYEVAIEQISRMCQRPKETAGTTQGVVVNGERLAGLILAVIKAAGLEGK